MVNNCEVGFIGAVSLNTPLVVAVCENERALTIERTSSFNEIYANETRMSGLRVEVFS